MAEAKYVTPAQVARALGVGVSTIKRWVDEGILPAHRTAGGHRKLLLADVMRLIHEREFPRLELSLLQADGAAPSCADPSHAAQSLHAALLEGDGETTRSILLGYYHAGMPTDQLADQVVAPALHRIGLDWEEGRIEMMHEHRATQLCMTALFELKSKLQVQARTDPPLAVGGAPELCMHGLGGLLAEMVLLDAGWAVVNLGPNTPLVSFRTALTELRPRLLWLSVNYLPDASRFLAEYRELYAEAVRAGVAVAVGGRALTADIRSQMPYTTFGDGMVHFGAFARSLHPRPRPRPRGRPPTDSP